MSASPYHFAENHVCTVQPGSRGSAEKELAAVRVLAGVRLQGRHALMLNNETHALMCTVRHSF
eukprot:1849143-Pyramimonas_sp.AAC.1